MSVNSIGDENGHAPGDCPGIPTPWLVIAGRALLALLVLALSVGGVLLAVGWRG